MDLRKRVCEYVGYMTKDEDNIEKGSVRESKVKEKREGKEG